MGRPGIHWAYTAMMIHGPHNERDYGPRHELHHGLRYMLSYAIDARRTNDCYCATLLLDRWTDNADI